MDHALHSVRERSKASPHEVKQLLAQVGRDLQPWQQSGITQEMVERAYCSWDINGESMRVQVKVLQHRFLILLTAAGLASCHWAFGQPCTQALSVKLCIPLSLLSFHQPPQLCRHSAMQLQVLQCPLCCQGQ